LNGALVIGFTLVRLNFNVQFSLRHAGLHLGAGLGFTELAFLDGGFLLAVVGFYLLGGNLTRT
jgi:hypothetical protein